MRRKRLFLAVWVLLAVAAIAALGLRLRAAQVSAAKALLAVRAVEVAAAVAGAYRQEAVLQFEMDCDTGPTVLPFTVSLTPGGGLPTAGDVVPKVPRECEVTGAHAVARRVVPPSEPVEELARRAVAGMSFPGVSGVAVQAAQAQVRPDGSGVDVRVVLSARAGLLSGTVASTGESGAGESTEVLAERLRAPVAEAARVTRGVRNAYRLATQMQAEEEARRKAAEEAARAAAEAKAQREAAQRFVPPQLPSIDQMWLPGFELGQACVNPRWCEE